MINYTNGETCHKIYERSTAILFSCDHSKNPVSSLQPMNKFFKKLNEFPK